MSNKIDSSWKLLHSLHLILFFIPVLGFIGFFRRFACCRQKRWLNVGIVYTALTVVALILCNTTAQSVYNNYMILYVLFYFAMIIYGCVTLPSYLNAVIARQEAGQTGHSPATVANPAAVPGSVQPGYDLTHNSLPTITEQPPEAVLHRIHDLGSVLDGQPIYAKLCEIETICNQIVVYVANNPNEKDTAHTFTSYYLPEYSKLLMNYIELYETQVKTDKVLEVMKQIEDSLPKTINSFKNLYNSLYSEKAADIAASINVLEKVMSEDGLSDMPNSGDSIQLKL